MQQTTYAAGAVQVEVKIANESMRRMDERMKGVLKERQMWEKQMQAVTGGSREN